MPSELLRSLAASFLMFSLTLLPFSQRGMAFQSASAEDTGWADYENYTVIDHNTTWNGQITHADIPKPVVVVNGATLTIEQGTHIELDSLTVYDGRIVALGTETEPIVFTKPVFDVSTIPPEDSVHDPKCFMPTNGMIEFADFVETDTEEPSFFRYVRFDGMGTYLQYDDEDCPALVGKEKQRRSMFNTAYAQSQTKYAPALKFQSGRLRIENSHFKNNAYADIETAMQFREGETPHDFLQVVNSNFEGNAQNTSLISNFEYVGEQTQDYSYRVLLKNNWYGSSVGPREAPDYIVGGERIVGQYVLDGFRSKSLIADPLIVVPGITGSAQVLGEWKLDPILHTYDDLIASLEGNGYEENINLFPFPYEWRNTNKTSALYLQAKIEGVLEGTRVSKADVVAHSMGGLVTRAYIEEIEGTQYENTIDQLLTLGTPHRGSPEAYLKWEAGEGFLTWKDRFARHHFEQEAEEAGYDDNLKGYIQDRVVSVRELLPDQNYLFDISIGQMREYSDNYPKNSFLEDLNTLGNIQKLNGVRFTNIVGKSGIQNTIAKIRVGGSSIVGQWEHGMPENFYDTNTDQGLEYGSGDETVPLASAQGIVSDKVIEIESAHGDLPTKAQCVVFQELTGKSECAYDENIHIPNILLFNVFSPIDIQIISPSDKKMGKNFETGGIYDEIPDAYYTGYDTENEFITIPNPEDGEYRILTQGTGEGEYRIEAVKITEGVTPEDEAKESVATFTGTATTGVLEEEKIEIIGDEVQVVEDNDILPPIITIASPESKSYLNNQVLPITYSVTDDISAEASIQKVITLDGGTFSEASIDLSSQPLGNHTLSIQAVDEAGNEATAGVNFKNTVTFVSLYANIDHYKALGLIKKAEDVKFIKTSLRYLEAVRGFIEQLKRMEYFPPKVKARLIRNFQRELEHKTEELTGYLEKRVQKGVIDSQVKVRIVEAVGMLVQ